MNILLHNEKIYAIGGMTEFKSNCNAGREYGRFLETMEVYDINTNQWSTSNAHMKNRRYECSLSLIASKIIVLGGSAEEKYVPAIEAYDIEEETWSGSIITPLSTQRHGFCAILVGINLYVIGGDTVSRSRKCLGSVEEFKYALTLVATLENAMNIFIPKANTTTNIQAKKHKSGLKKRVMTPNVANKTKTRVNSGSSNNSGGGSGNSSPHPKRKRPTRPEPTPEKRKSAKKTKITKTTISNSTTKALNSDIANITTTKATKTTNSNTANITTTKATKTTKSNTSKSPTKTTTKATNTSNTPKKKQEEEKAKNTNTRRTSPRLKPSKEKKKVSSNEKKRTQPKNKPTTTTTTQPIKNETNDTPNHQSQHSPCKSVLGLQLLESVQQLMKEKTEETIELEVEIFGEAQEGSLHYRVQKVRNEKLKTMEEQVFGKVKRRDYDRRVKELEDYLGVELS